MAIPATYNLTGMGNSSGFVDLFTQVNTQIMQGYFGLLIVFSAAMIIFLISFFVTESPNKAFIGSLFSAFVLGILFNLMGLFSDLMLYSTLGVLIFAVGMSFFGNE